nr:hypothetical protein [Natronocella acetinitrilica]
MEPKYRVGLISALNPSNVRYLCGIARDEHLLETLELAGDDVQASLMQALPDWRRARIVEQLQQRVAAEKKGKDKDRGKRDRPDWLSRLVRVVRHKDR